MKISDILNNPTDETGSAAQVNPGDLSSDAHDEPQRRPLDLVHDASKARPVAAPESMTGNITHDQLRRVSSFTAPSPPDVFNAQTPEAHPMYKQPEANKLSQENLMQTHPNALPSVLPPVPQQQNARVRLRPEVDTSLHTPVKRARRNTADNSAHSTSDHPDSPSTPGSVDTGRWSSFSRPLSRTGISETSLPLEPTMIIDQPPSSADESAPRPWKNDGPQNGNLPHFPPPPTRSASSSSTFVLPNAPRDGLSKGNSIYPEPTMASISSAGSSAWHSVNGSYYNLPMNQDEPMSTPKSAPVPPPPAIRRPSVPKPIPTKIAPPPAFRRRTTSATELLDHPQIKAALQKHKELSWKAVQEQVGGVWEPKGELKVMFGDGAPGNLMKRYSASEILDPANWNRSQRGENESAEGNQRIWFQIRPQMKGASEVKSFRNPDVDVSDVKTEGSGQSDTAVESSTQGPDKLGHEKLVSASKELMINQLFPKYEPSIPGLPAGAIYLRHDHDRFEYRPYGWGRREDDSTEGNNASTTASDPQYLAMVRTPSGTPGGRFIPPSNRRLLQWSFAQARWLFVLNEMPSLERPKKAGGYPVPDRLNSFLQQGDVVPRLDVEESASDHTEWEWVLPIRPKLWVSPMDEIVKKCGANAAPVWDLGGRMLWDSTVGQWKFEVGPPTREVCEVLQDNDGIGREVIFDVCEGGRPRVSWDDFMSARQYFLVLQRKITKLKARARERTGVRLNPNELSGDMKPKIKQEDDLESNFSDLPLDPDTTMVSARSNDEQRAEYLSEHGQRCSATLLNMMMSVSHVTPAATHIPKLVQDNAMSLELGPPGGTETIRIGRVLKNGGFGEIGGSPSLSPTNSHASTRRSISVSVEDDNGSP